MNECNLSASYYDIDPYPPVALLPHIVVNSNCHCYGSDPVVQ